MEGKNMARQEARPGVSAFSAVRTPTREAPAPVVVPRKIETVPASPQPDKQPPKAKKPWIQRMIGNLGVRIGLGVLAVGGAGYAARETISNNLPSLSRPAETPAFFDPAADKGTISAANSIIITDLKEIESIPTIPPGTNPKHDINILAPSLNPSPGKKIDYSKSFSGGESPSFTPYAPEETKYAKEQNVKEKWIFKDVPQNTVIPAPADGLLEFSMRPKVDPAGTVDGVNLYYKGSDGAAYQLAIFGDPGDHFKPSVDAKPFSLDDDISLDDRMKLWVPVKRGDTIMVTLQQTNLWYKAKAWPSGEIGVGSNKTYPVNINFITLPDGAGQDKVAILAK